MHWLVNKCSILYCFVIVKYNLIYIIGAPGEKGSVGSPGQLGITGSVVSILNIYAIYIFRNNNLQNFFFFFNT